MKNAVTFHDKRLWCTLNVVERREGKIISKKLNIPDAFITFASACRRKEMFKWDMI